MSVVRQPRLIFSHFRLLRNHRTEFNETYQKASTQRPLQSLCFSSRSEPISPPYPLMCWDIFDFTSAIAKRNLTKLDRKLVHNVFYQVCVFRIDLKNQYDRPCLWFAETLSTSPLQPPSRIHRNLTGSKILHSCTKLCFSCRSENQDCRPGLWLPEIFFTSLQPLNIIQWNLTERKISTSSTNFVFFKLNMKKVLKVVLKTLCFDVNRKTKITTLANLYGKPN